MPQTYYFIEKYEIPGNWSNPGPVDLKRMTLDQESYCTKGFDHPLLPDWGAWDRGRIEADGAG